MSVDDLLVRLQGLAQKDWATAWEDEARGPHGEWIGGGAAHAVLQAFQMDPGVKRGNGRDTSDAEDKATEYAKKAFKQSTDAQGRKALEEYASTADEGDAGKNINSLLRSGGDTSEFNQTISDIDAAIADSVTNHDIVVFRGLPTDSLQQGDEIVDNGYVSSSLLAATAEYFADKGGAIVEIHIPKGSHVLSMDNANADKNNLGESEVLLPRSSHFRVEAVQTGKSKGVTPGTKFQHVVITYMGHE